MLPGKWEVCHIAEDDRVGPSISFARANNKGVIMMEEPSRAPEHHEGTITFCYNSRHDGCPRAWECLNPYFWGEVGMIIEESGQEWGLEAQFQIEVEVMVEGKDYGLKNNWSGRHKCLFVNECHINQNQKDCKIIKSNTSNYRALSCSLFDFWKIVESPTSPPPPFSTKLLLKHSFT